VGPAEPVLFFEHGFVSVRIPASFLLQASAGTAQATSRPPTGRPASVPHPPKPAKPVHFSAPSKRPSTRAPFAPERSADSLAGVRALADAGRLREAAERGAALLARGEPSMDLLYTLAVVADAAGDGERAEAFYRKTLYLDPRHADALGHLALLLDKRGDARGARQLRQRLARSTTREAV
jgi:chemotaxis protein methyltransferase WspC